MLRPSAGLILFPGLPRRYSHSTCLWLNSLIWKPFCAYKRLHQKFEEGTYTADSLQRGSGEVGTSTTDKIRRSGLNISLSCILYNTGNNNGYVAITWHNRQVVLLDLTVGNSILITVPHLERKDLRVEEEGYLSFVLYSRHQYETAEKNPETKGHKAAFDAVQATPDSSEFPQGHQKVCTLCRESGPVNECNVMAIR